MSTTNTIKLDFSRELLFLDGQPIQDPNTGNNIVISKMLATNLSQLQKGGLRMFHWALELYQTGYLMLNKTDRDLLRQTVEDMPISSLVQGRILDIIDDAEKLHDSHGEIMKTM
jgi:hypothetical protein